MSINFKVFWHTNYLQYIFFLFFSPALYIPVDPCDAQISFVITEVIKLVDIYKSSCKQKQNIGKLNNKNAIV